MIRAALFITFTASLGSLAVAQKQESKGVTKPDGTKAPTPHSPPRAVPHRVVRVTPEDAKAPGEVSVAINPVFRDHIVVTSFQRPQPGKYFTNNHTYSSTDGGLTWQAAAAPNPERRNQGDDSVTFGPDGTVYHCYLSALGYRDPSPNRACSGLFVRRSIDGVKWDPPVPIVDHINTVEPMEDKPWIVVDGVRGSPHRGNVYVSWTRFDKYGTSDPEFHSRIYFSRSRDGGKSFGSPVRVSDKSGNALDDSGTVEGAVPAIGPKGEIYVAWAGPEGIQIDKSNDGGFSFGKDVKVADQPGGWSFAVPGIGRHNGLPVTACDVSRGKFRGSVYVCWIDKRNGDPDVFVAASRDEGKTWKEPVRVNTDSPKNGKDQLFAWLAVDPVDGSLNVVFYDRRTNEGPKDTKLAVMVARSVDGGETFANYSVNLDPFAVGQAFMGDYIGIAALDGRVVAVFPHFISPTELAVSAALFRFRQGTLDAIKTN
ncbi:MAG TPA: sialidase family protein [Gemmata sp.]|nr:sialidase family protein [Gemmata sp.]